MASDVTEGQQKHFMHTFILPFFPTPQAMGYPIEMMECIGMVDTS